MKNNPFQWSWNYNLIFLLSKSIWTRGDNIRDNMLHVLFYELNARDLLLFITHWNSIFHISWPCWHLLLSVFNNYTDFFGLGYITVLVCWNSALYNLISRYIYIKTIFKNKKLRKQNTPLTMPDPQIQSNLP